MNFTVYSKPGCPQCSVLKMKLNAAGIKYTLHEDEAEIMALGVKAAPVLIVDGVMHIGPDAIKWFNKWSKEHINGN